MTSRTSSTLLLLVLGGAVLVASLAVLPESVPIAVKAVLPTIAAIGTGLGARFLLDRENATTTQRVIDAESRLAEHARIASELRHDIRGYLSPALLNADRLSTHADGTVRRAAETMIVTVERIESRLRDS